MADRTPREATTRAKVTRRKPWTPPSKLEAPEAPEGYRHRWIRTSIRGEDDKINVKLHYFICSHANGEIILSEHEDSAWVTKNEFKNYNFAEGDSDIINLL